MCPGSGARVELVDDGPLEPAHVELLVGVRHSAAVVRQLDADGAEVR